MTTLDDMIDSLRKLGVVEIETKVATKGAKRLEEWLLKSLAAGTSPDGKPWAPKKRGGGKPYAHAASKLTVAAYGSLIRAAVSGPEAWGQFGPRGAPIRQMVPDGGAGIPPEVQRILDEAATDMFEEATK